MSENPRGSRARIGMLTFEYGSIRCGGMGATVTALARRLDRERFQPVVILPRSGHSPTWHHLEHRDVPYAVADRYDDDGVEVWLLANERLGDGPVYLEPYEHAGIKKTDEYGERVANLLVDLDLDLVHLHDAYGYKCLWEARCLRVPTVFTVHRLHEDEPPLAFAELVAMRLADHITTVSEPYRVERADVLGMRDDVAVIENGIDLDFWSIPSIRASGADRAERRRRTVEHLGLSDAPTFAFVGRLDRDQKGVDVLLDMLATRGGPLPFNVVVAGEGDRLLADRIAEIAACFPHHVRAINRALTPEEVRALFAAVDAVVVPSRYEPFGLILLEAVAMGALPVASRTGGLAAVVDGATFAHEVPPGNPVALGRAMDSAAALLLRPADRGGARAAAVTRATHYSAQRMADAYGDLYARTLRCVVPDVGRSNAP
ncbi:MAG: glycosyltransferase [Phycicoccus sp.]